MYHMALDFKVYHGLLDRYDTWIAFILDLHEGEAKWTLWGFLFCRCEHIVIFSILGSHSCFSWIYSIHIGWLTSWCRPIVLFHRHFISLPLWSGGFVDGYCELGTRFPFGHDDRIGTHGIFMEKTTQYINVLDT